MRLVAILLLSGLNSFAQTSLPSSGPMNMNDIKSVMYNLGEITSGERAGATSIAFLNGKSHLSDKTAPYSLSDWYGYTGGGPTVYSKEFTPGLTEGSLCNFSPTGGSNVYYWTAVSTPTVGTVLYTNLGMTVTVSAGKYLMIYGGGGPYIVYVVNSSGVVTQELLCIP